MPITGKRIVEFGIRIADYGFWCTLNLDLGILDFRIPLSVYFLLAKYS
jgi:hypothetical protein